MIDHIKWMLIANLCLLATIGSDIQADENKVLIELESKEQSINDSLIRIADVAVIRVNNNLMAKAIGQLDLEEIQVGETKEISASQIRLRIQLANVPYKRLVFSGPSEVQIRRQNKDQIGTKIQDAISKAIAKQFSLSEKDVRVALSSEVGTISSVDDLVENLSNADVILPSKLPLGSTEIRFLVSGNRGGTQSIRVRCRIAVLSEVVISKRYISRGEKFKIQDLTVVRRPVEERRLKPASFKEVIGKTAAANIDSYQVVEIGDIAKESNSLLVRRNDIVDAIVLRRNLRMRYKNVKVLSNGRLGDKVEVLNTESDRTFIASVVSDSLVEVK